MPIEKRQRSPSVPFIGLMTATVGARELYDRVGRAPLLPSEAAEIWGLAAKTGSAFRRIAALRGYGLIEKADHADRIRISDLAAILLETQEPEASQRAFAAAALGPEIIADYAGRWSAGRPSDPVCIADLQTRHRFTEPAAKSFLPVFDEAMWFVGGGATGVVGAGPQAPSPSSSVSIGDFVRLPTDTGDQFPDGHRVVWLADGGRFLYVEKTLVRYPVQAITRIKPSSSPSPPSRSHRPRAVNTGEEATPNSEAGHWLDFPRIDLHEALHYLERLVDAAGRNWMPIFELANLWFEQPHLAEARRIAAGLCDFGFAEQQGRGRSRKLRATELGWRAKHFDTPAGVYAVREGISRSRLIVHYARVWQAAVPPPDLALKQLQREQGFSAQRAARFLAVFINALTRCAFR